MMTQVQLSSKQVADAVQAAGQRIEGIHNSLKSFASSALSVLGSLGIAGSLKSAFEKFEEYEKMTIRLGASIKTSGRDVQTTMKDYQGFADEMTKQTTLSKGQVMALIQQAEKFGFAGDKAKEYVKIATSVSAISGDEVLSVGRATRAIVSGHPEQAKRVLGLQHIKEQSQLVVEVNKKLAAGWLADKEMMQTAGFQLTLLHRTFAGITKEVGGLVAQGLNPLVTWLNNILQQVMKLSPEVKEWIVKFVLLTGAVLAAGPVWKGLMLVLEPVGRLIRFLVIDIGGLIIKIVAITVAWAAWAAVMIPVKLFMTGFNLIMALLTGNIAAGAIATSIYTVAVGIAKVATVLWSAALAVVNFLLSPASLFAAVATIGLLALAFTAVTGIVGGLISGVKAVFEILSNITLASGPLKAVGDIFREWGSILKSIWEGMQVDMPKAWKLLKAGFNLAVLEIQQMWRPLWDYIKSGFEAAAKAASRVFQAEMDLAMIKIKQATTIALHGGVEEMRRRELASGEERAQMARKNAAKELQKDLEAAAAAFNIPPDTPALIAARAEVKALQDQVDNAVKAAEAGGAKAAAAMKNSVKKEKLDVALFGGSEFFTRLENYLDKIHGEDDPAKKIQEATAEAAKVQRETARTVAAAMRAGTSMMRGTGFTLGENQEAPWRSPEAIRASEEERAEREKAKQDRIKQSQDDRWMNNFFKDMDNAEMEDRRKELSGKRKEREERDKRLNEPGRAEDIQFTGAGPDLDDLKKINERTNDLLKKIYDRMAAQGIDPTGIIPAPADFN